MIKYSKSTGKIGSGNFTDIFCQNTDTFQKIGRHLHPPHNPPFATPLVMCVQHVIQKILHSPQKKNCFLLLRVFSVDHGSYLKNQKRCFAFKSNLNMKNLNIYLKLISYGIIFKTNIFMKWLSAWLLSVKVMVDKGRPKFLYISKEQKSVLAMAHRLKRRNILPIQHVRMCHAYCFR